MARAADWQVVGQLTQASNATLLVEIDGRRHVYKPVAGEAPLWDFPTGTLGRREVAVHDIAQLLAWDVVPATRWVDSGPFGPGMVQEWVADERTPVGAFTPGDVPEGWLPIATGYDGDDRPVVLAHADSWELQRLAAFDVIVNNADRKGGHVLGGGTGPVLGIDHGLCLHEAPKLRTVLWGFAGRPVPDELVADLDRALPGVAAAVVGLAPSEAEALGRRIRSVLAEPVFPGPTVAGPAFPWPAL